MKKDGRERQGGGMEEREREEGWKREREGGGMEEREREGGGMEEGRLTHPLPVVYSVSELHNR